MSLARRPTQQDVDRIELAQQREFGLRDRSSHFAIDYGLNHPDMNLRRMEIGLVDFRLDWIHLRSERYATAHSERPCGFAKP